LWQPLRKSLAAVALSFDVLNIDRLSSLIIARQTMSVDGQSGQLD